MDIFQKLLPGWPFPSLLNTLFTFRNIGVEAGGYEDVYLIPYLFFLQSFLYSLTCLSTSRFCFLSLNLFFASFTNPHLCCFNATFFPRANFHLWMQKTPIGRFCKRFCHYHNDVLADYNIADYISCIIILCSNWSQVYRISVYEIYTCIIITISTVTCYSLIIWWHYPHVCLNCNNESYRNLLY